MPSERPVFLNAFLFRIIKNHAMNRWRFLNNSKRNGNNILSFDELEDCIDGKSDTESGIDEDELAGAINEFLESLDKGKRFIFIRRYWYLDSLAVIAEQCSVREENIKTILARIRKNLKKFLNERGFYG